MKTKFALVLLLFITDSRADTFTLALIPSSPPVYATTNFDIPTNVVARIVSANVPFATLTITINGASLNIPSSNGGISNPPTVAGPATITIGGNSGGVNFCTIETGSALSVPVTPTASVVIPADTNGPVNIILESSTDLVNWTAALPGKYGTTTSNRFFRVRAER